ncbi:MAG TPA: EF-hand domain-containing protein [Candidatus Ozemobacteraceae bacterium]|nr:EF-hand domain-containing protein [Candidatus Ozemobacteraceae bacterium]
MSTGGISSSDVSSLRDRFQQFQSGQARLQKEDLTQLKDKLASANDPAAAGVDSLIKAFDKIDTNSDGMSADELDAYANAAGSRSAAEDSSPASRSITINISPLVLDGGETAGAGRPPHGPGGAQRGAGGPPPMGQDAPQTRAAQDDQESSGVTSGLLVNIKVQMQNSGQLASSEDSDALTALSSLDKNQDGKISAEELVSALQNQDPASKGDDAASGDSDLKKLLEKAIAALEKNQGKGSVAATPEGGEAVSGDTDLKGLLEKAIAAVGKNQGKDSAAVSSQEPSSASAKSAGGSSDMARKNISKYTMTASMTYERQESSFSFQYA